MQVINKNKYCLESKLCLHQR